MEKDISFLRGSKLNCYAEFNKMVQALTRHTSKQPAIYAFRKRVGTSAEYNFYTTLITMLREIVNNNSTSLQERELQKVYEWFNTNKQLMRLKKRTSLKTPKLSFAVEQNSSSAHLERPQTAPSSTYRLMPVKSDGKEEKRPFTTFTSAYISRSFGHSIIIGQAFDQLTTTGMEENHRHATPNTKKTGSHSRSGEKSPVQVSIQSHPSPDFLVDYVPPGFTGVQPHLVGPVRFGDLYSLAPGVAAQMTLERELEKDSELCFMREMLSQSVPASPYSSRHLNTPVLEPPVTVVSDSKSPLLDPTEVEKKNDEPFSTECADPNLQHVIKNEKQPPMVSELAEMSSIDSDLLENQKTQLLLGDKNKIQKLPHDRTNLPLETIAEVCSTIISTATSSVSSTNQSAVAADLVTEHVQPNEDKETVTEEHIVLKEKEEMATGQLIRPKEEMTGQLDIEREIPNDNCLKLSSEETETEPLDMDNVSLNSSQIQLPLNPTIVVKFPAIDRKIAVIRRSPTVVSPSFSPKNTPGISHSKGPSNTPSIVAGFRMSRYRTMPPLKL